MRSEKDVTVSKIIVIVRGLTSILQQFLKEAFSNVTKNLIEDLLTSTLTRFDKCEYNSVLSKPSLLDPRFKLKAFSLEETRKKGKDMLQDEAVACIKKHCESVNENIDVAGDTEVQADNQASDDLIRIVGEV